MIALVFSTALFATQVATISGAFSATVLPHFVSTVTHRATVRLSVGGSGWDNDSFLSSLSPDDTKEGDFKNIKRPDDEGSMGGSRFADMMAKAKNSNPRPSVDPYYNVASPSSSSFRPPIVPKNSPSTSFVAGGVDLSKLTTEEQAALFRQFMANTAPSSSSLPTRSNTDYYPEERPKVLPGGLAPDGRKVGRNRDADTIANTGDLYLAQLKRDSTVRTRARYEGDLDKAEAVFEDATVKEIASTLTTNPYLEKEDTAEELALMGTVAEELAIIRSTMQNVQPVDVTSAGIKYKDKLKMKRNAKKEAPLGPESVVVQRQKVTEPVVEKQEPAVVAQPVMVQQAPAVVAKPVMVQQEPVVVAKPVAPQPVVPSPIVSESRAARTVEESRQDIRKLQGLLLKHRGGSGFGSGLLRGEEVPTFQTTLQDVITCLRGEADSVSVQPPVVAPVVIAPTAVVPAVDTMGASQAMGPTLACVEGAILMYKNSPVEMQPIMAPTLRAALLVAVNTCTTVIGDSGAPPSPLASDESKMMATLACVEGAVLMFKNSPVEMQSMMLPTLRAALVASVTTCDQVIGGSL